MAASNKESIFDRRDVRIAYFSLLVLLIPGAIIFNSLYAVNRFQEDFTTELQRKALLATNVIDAAVQVQGIDPGFFQELVHNVAAAGEEFLALDIFVPIENGFLAVASLDAELVGKVVRASHLDLVLSQGQPIAFQTDDPSDQTIEDELTETSGAFWVVSRTLQDDEQNSVALISVKFSSEFIDSLVSKTLRTTYILLVLSVLLIVAVLAALFLILRNESIWKSRVSRLDEEKTKFITVTTHLLRTPLNSLNWSLESLLGGAFGKIKKDQEAVIRDLYQNNRRMTNALNDLVVALDVSQETLNPTLSTTKLGGIIDSIVLETKDVVAAKELSLNVLVPEDIPDMQADPNLTHQAIFKLVDNAIRYSNQSGSIDIKVRFDTRGIDVVVGDDGVGIPKDEQDSLFKPFVRGRAAVKMATDQPGLGLFIAQEIARVHGGEITFVSTEGKGSTFTFHIPLVASQA